MLDDEGGIQSEAYRKLRINLDFANLSIKARTIMITSASEQEGKSTTVANLAIALARAGRRVVLVDLDLREAVPRPLLRPHGPAGTEPTPPWATSRSTRRCGRSRSPDPPPGRSRARCTCSHRGRCCPTWLISLRARS